MFKYEVKSFEEFYTCIIKEDVVYIEEFTKNYPIPSIYGMVFPFKNDGKLNIALCTRDNNPNMSEEDFEKMIINCKLTDDAKVNMFNLEYLNYLYNTITNGNYSLFVLDALIERAISFN